MMKFKFKIITCSSCRVLVSSAEKEIMSSVLFTSSSSAASVLSRLLQVTILVEYYDN